jgi:hypothetical protein
VSKIEHYAVQPRSIVGPSPGGQIPLDKVGNGGMSLVYAVRYLNESGGEKNSRTFSCDGPTAAITLATAAKIDCARLEILCKDRVVWSKRLPSFGRQAPAASENVATPG